MPKTARRSRRVIVKRTRQYHELCSEDSWENNSDFRAVVMALSDWKDIPAYMFFDKKGFSLPISQVCDQIPIETLRVAESIRKHAAGKRLGEAEYMDILNKDIEDIYLQWEISVDEAYHKHKQTADALVREIEEKFTEAGVPTRLMTTAARALIFKRYPHINALAMMDPYGRPLSIRGMVRASMLFI